MVAGGLQFPVVSRVEESVCSLFQSLCCVKVQRQAWIRQKDAATAGFRKECEAEVEHIK